MIWLRKGIVHLFALALFVTLIGVAAIINFNRNLAQPEQVKQLLAESGVYDHAVSAALEKSQADAPKEGNDGSIQLTHTIVQQAAKRSFTPQVLELNAEKFIDANYAWLAGKTPTPEFSLDLTEPKQTFAALVGEYTTNRLKTLPTCTPDELAKLQLPVDSMEVTCLPAGIDPQTEGDRIAAEVAASNFLSKPVITASSLGRDENKPGKTYYQQIEQAPKFYQLSQKLPLVLAVAALLCILAIIFIAPTRRKGWRRVGVVLLLAGIALIATTFVSKTVVNNLENKLDDSVTSQLVQPRTDFLNALQSNLAQINLTFGAVFIILALAIFIKLYASRDSRPKPAKTAKPAAAPPALRPAAPAPKPRPTGGMDISAPVQPARPASPKPNPSADIQLRRPVTPASGPPQLKKPKKRPPRLIQ